MKRLWQLLGSSKLGLFVAGACFDMACRYALTGHYWLALTGLVGVAAQVWISARCLREVTP